MTGTIDLDDDGDGEVAVIEENGEWSLYLRSDIEEKSDGSWGPKAGATPSGALNLGAGKVGELFTNDLTISDQSSDTDYSITISNGLAMIEEQ
jgi:hypothetical protein